MLLVPPFVVLVEGDPSRFARRPSCSPNNARTTEARVKMMQQQTRPVLTLELEAFKADKDTNIEPVSTMSLIDFKNTK